MFMGRPNGCIGLHQNTVHGVPVLPKNSVMCVRAVVNPRLRKRKFQSGCGWTHDPVDADTIGDIENARALFEGALADENGATNPEMWDAFLQFEHSHGTLSEATALEARRASALSDRRVQLPVHDSFQLMLRRGAVQGLWGCTLELRRYLEGVLQPADTKRSTSGRSTSGYAYQCFLFQN